VPAKVNSTGRSKGEKKENVDDLQSSIKTESKATRQKDDKLIKNRAKHSNLDSDQPFVSL